MKGTVFLAAVMVILSSSAFAAPQMWRGSDGWGAQSRYGRLYNPATVETFTGTVEAVERMTPMRGMGAGIHLKVKSDKETATVHLGPSWYIERQDTKILKGDVVEVKGSRVTVAGKPVIIAAEVKKGDETLRLRDDSGVPAWSGWRKGQPPAQ